MPADLEEDDLKPKLNLETGRIPWRDLQTFFARGQVVRVSPSLDLLQVGESLAADDRQQFESWMQQGTIGEVSPEQAQTWFDTEAELWALVVAPWVLVQDPTQHH